MQLLQDFKIILTMYVGRLILRAGRIPVSPLDAVTKQPDQILVPNAPNCINFYPELLFCLTPERREKRIKRPFYFPSTQEIR